MKIEYKKKNSKSKFISGLMWLANGMYQTVQNENTNFSNYFWISLSRLYLILFYYQKKEKYLTIENGVIKKNWPFGRKMNLNEIKEIRHFSGEYTLTFEMQDMKINIDLIDEKSLSKLKTELNKLNVEWT
jgi:hypothetical protein